MSEIEAKSDTTCCGVLIKRTFRHTGGEAVAAGWPLDGEVFTEGESGGARTKRGEVTATEGPPNLLVGVSGLFLFTAIMWKVSRIAIIVRQYVPDW
jgi:hypothetical protein